MKYPLARLCAERWNDFYRETLDSGESQESMDLLDDLAMGLFSSPEIMLKWVQLCDPDQDTGGVDFTINMTGLQSALYYAALLELPGIVIRLIQMGIR